MGCSNSTRAKARSGARPEIEAKSREGIDHPLVRGDELRDLQPGLSPRIIAATFIPRWQTVTDPYDYAVAVGAAAQARGASFRGPRSAASAARRRRADRLHGQHGAHGRHGGGRRRRLVTAAGRAARRPHPARDRARLQHDAAPRRLRPAAASSSSPAMALSSRRSTRAARRRRRRTRRADRPPNFARAEAMLREGQPSCPGSRPRAARTGWAFAPRCRIRCPSSAGRARRPQVVYAFGHGHLGLTQAAATGRLDRRTRHRRSRRRSISPRSRHNASKEARHGHATPSSASTATPAAIRSGWSPAAARCLRARP